MTPEEIKKKISKLEEKRRFVNDTWDHTGNRELLSFVVEVGTKLFDCERVSLFLHACNFADNLSRGVRHHQSRDPFDVAVLPATKDRKDHMLRIRRPGSRIETRQAINRQRHQSPHR